MKLSTIIYLGLWKRLHPADVHRAQWDNRHSQWDDTHKCEVIEFSTYREKYTEDQITVRNWIWWSELRYKRRMEKVADHHKRNNGRNNPKPRR